MWNGGLKRLELARGEAELIAAFGDLRTGGGRGSAAFLQHRDMMMLVEAAGGFAIEIAWLLRCSGCCGQWGTKDTKRPR